MDRSSYKFLDMRSSTEYSEEHLTKPPRCSVNVPWEGSAGDWVASVSGQFPNRATGLLVACADGGATSAQAAEALVDAGYSSAFQVEGGFSGWTQVFSTSGRRKPPPGRWVSTGKEALKSGLNIPGVAESYDEGGNLITARYAEGLRDGQALPPSSG